MKTPSHTYKYPHLGLIYQLIEQFELISRTDLAKLAKQAPASITHLSKTLIEHRLVWEKTSQNLPNRGRPAVGLSLHTQHWQYLCLILSEVELSICLCDLTGHPIYQQQYAFNLKAESGFESELSEMIQHFFKQAAIEMSQLLAVSVSVMGKLDHKKRHILQLGNRKMVADILLPLQLLSHKPIYLNEHFQLWLLAESSLGSLIRHNDVIFLQLDESINLSVLLRGKLLHQDEHKRMNIDKMCMPRFSALSDLIGAHLMEPERYQLANQITFTALSKAIDHYFPNSFTRTDEKIGLLCQKIQQKDANALAILEHITDNLAYMLFTLVHLFSTEKIMICSPLLTIQPVLFQQLQHKLDGHLQQDALKVDLVTSQYQWNSPLIPAIAIKHQIYTGNLIQNIIKR